MAKTKSGKDRGNFDVRPAPKCDNAQTAAAFIQGGAAASNVLMKSKSSVLRADGTVQIRTTVYLELEVDEALRIHCVKTREKQTGVINQALRQYLDL